VDARSGERLRLATGLSTAVTRTGDPDGRPAVLLLHSWATSRHEFARLQPLLPPSVPAVAVDLRGHGDADRPPSGYGVDVLAADVVAVLDAIGWRRAVLVGSSSGGYVAQQVAVDAADRVAGLVLAGSPHDLRGRAPFADEIDGLGDPVDPGWVRAFTTSFAEADVPDRYVDLVVADALRMPAATWRATLAGLSGSPPPTGTGRISAPTLIVSGARDTVLTTGQTRALVAALPGAQWVEYADAGHVVLWDRPERLAADIRRFLDGLR
jgi:pimeloyl-ACP methyl ester carboxylesterase